MKCQQPRCDGLPIWSLQCFCDMNGNTCQLPLEAAFFIIHQVQRSSYEYARHRQGKLPAPAAARLTVPSRLIPFFKITAGTQIARNLLQCMPKQSSWIYPLPPVPTGTTPKSEPSLLPNTWDHHQASQPVPEKKKT